MPGFTEKQVEVEARRILRAKIKAMPWHAGLPPDERKRLIEADVDRWWHLEVKEAARQLLDALDDTGQLGVVPLDLALAELGRSINAPYAKSRPSLYRPEHPWLHRMIRGRA